MPSKNGSYPYPEKEATGIVKSPRKEEVSCTLTDEDRIRIGSRLAKNNLRLEQLAEDRKDFNAENKRSQDALKAENYNHTRALNEGVELRVCDVEDVFNFVEGEIYTYRMDGDHPSFLKKRKMSDTERAEGEEKLQSSLPGIEKKKSVKVRKASSEAKEQPVNTGWGV